MRVKGIQRN
uniref:Truncated envelope glycoprotein n=1 Tax=Human immunodeficiency virus type 1 TaxID=11676 RepID=D5LLR5_HV1|nr:truncated envelope glycoprotein [Human immunodeficiency virus 1]